MALERFYSTHPNAKSNRTVRRLNSQRLNANIESEDISPEEKDAILNIFKRNNVGILDSYFDVTEDETDDCTYNVFVVSTENMNATVLGYLQSDLRELEDDFDIGFNENDGDNGFYSKRYEFYHYIDDLDSSKHQRANTLRSQRNLNASLSDDFISQVNRAVRTHTGFIIARKAVGVNLGDGTYMFLVEDDEGGLCGILQNGQQINFQDEGEAQGYIENSWL